MATTVLLFTSDKMLTKDDGIIIRSIRASFDGPRYLTFARDIRFDEDDVFNTNDYVSVTINGTTAFTGYVLDRDPTLDSREYIEYRAAGPRVKLQGEIFTKDGSGRVIYNSEDDSDTFRTDGSAWTYGQILSEIISYSGTGLYTEAPETSFIGMNKEDCIRYIISRAGNVGFYITPSGTKRVIDLGSTTSKDVYIGEIGQRVIDHSEYDVIRANLNWSVAGCKTKCTVEGSKRKYEETIDLVPDWNPALEPYFNYTAYMTGKKPYLAAPDGDYSAIYRNYKFSETRNILSNLISEDKSAYTEYYREEDGVWFPYQASIDLENRKVIFPTPICRYWIMTGSIVMYPGLRTYRSEGRQARITCVMEGDKLFETIGYTGTAWTNRGITDAIYIVDDSLIWENVARLDEDSARDDTGKMKALATELLAPVKDERVTGTILLDGLDLTWGLENNVNIRNASSGKWDNLHAAILSVILYPDNETTELQISTTHYR